MKTELTNGMQKSILLHFINRDIRESTKCRLEDKDIERIVFLSMFMSPIIYAELTFELESKDDIPNTINFLRKLNELDIVTAISSANSLEELVVSRRTLYKFDEERYSFYFNDDELFFPFNSLIIDSSTTAFIKEQLGKKYIYHEDLDSNHSHTYENFLSYIVTRRLSVSSNQAFTIRSFDWIFNDLLNNGVGSTPIVSARNFLGRELSGLHNKKYLESTFSSIIKNIPYIYMYDEIDDESIYDYQIYQSILKPILYRYRENELEEKIVYWKSDGLFNVIIQRLYEFVTELQNILMEKYPMINPKVVSKRIIAYINQNIEDARISNNALSTTEEILNYVLLITDVNKYKSLGWRKNRMIINQEKIRREILLPVANMEEFRSIIYVAEESGFPLHRQVIGNNTFHCFFDEFHSLYIVKCEAGSLGASASILTLTDAINNIGVDTIIFSGIAFGNYTKRDGKQKEGDILVSKQLWNYESGKVDNDNYIPRGDKCSATPWLLDRFQNSSLKWEESNIHFGVVASGEKLSNSKDFVEKLMLQEPELIGGEMEGVGLVSVAERYRKNWILVKGISDWGVDKADIDQSSTAKKTFRFVFQTIKEYLM